MATTNQTPKTVSALPGDDYDPRNVARRAIDDAVLDLVGPLYLDEKIIVADFAYDQARRLGEVA